MGDDMSVHDATERALRSGLARLADHAPVAITDLDRKLARRVASARRRRHTTLGGIAAVVLICGIGGAVALAGPGSPQMASSPTGGPADPLACPRDLSTLRLPTGRPGISTLIVPGAPTQAMVCAYGAGGGLLGVTSLPAGGWPQLSAVVAQLNAISVQARGRCASTMTGAVSQVLFRFGYPAGAAVNVLATPGRRCACVTNGARAGTISTTLSVLRLIEIGLSTPGPVPATTTGNTIEPGTGGASSLVPGPRSPAPARASLASGQGTKRRRASAGCPAAAGFPSRAPDRSWR